MFYACGVVLTAWSLSALVELPGVNLPRHVAFMMAAWVVWVVALRMGFSLPGTGGRLDLSVIFAIAITMRLVLLSTPPSLSDDVYRSVWDSRLMHAGINPYAYPPGAPELESYRDAEIWPRVNHPEQRTPYPPLAEILSAAAYAVAPERLAAMQALAAIADLLCAAGLAWLLSRCGMDPRRCVVVAWSPLGALHFAHSGHNDALMILAVLAGALALSFGRRWLAMAALGVGTAVKVLPIFMVPAFARVTGLLAIGAWFVTCVLLALPLVGSAPGLALGVLQEAGTAQFNDSLHLLIQRLVQPVFAERASAVASAIGLLCVAVAGLMSWRVGDRSPRTALVNGSRVIAAYILVAPVVEPWYFTWLAPLVAFELRPAYGRPWFRLGDAPAWLWLSGMVSLTDLTYLPGGEGLWVTIRAVEYLPAYMILAGALLWKWRSEVGVHRSSRVTGS